MAAKRAKDTGKPGVKSARKPAKLAETTAETAAKSGVTETPKPTPNWSLRPCTESPNEFQIFDGESPVGERLTPSDSATVMRWLMGHG